MKGSYLLSISYIPVVKMGISQQPEKADALSTNPITQVGKLRLREVASIACGFVQTKGQAGILHASEPGASLPSTWRLAP